MKLIKKFFDGWNHFYLKNEKGDTIGTTKFPFPPEMVLISKNKNVELSRLCYKNCETIEKGYDLDELTIECVNNTINKELEGDVHRLSIALGFKKGFEKALEIIGNKRFDSKDMFFAFIEGTNVGSQAESMCDYDSGNNYEAHMFAEEAEKEFSETLKLKTEWDVVIETEPHYNKPKNNNNETISFEPILKPKLDSEGCIILKVKKL